MKHKKTREILGIELVGWQETVAVIGVLLLYGASAFILVAMGLR